MWQTGSNPFLFFGALTAGIGGCITYLVWSQTSATLLLSAFVGINVAALVSMGLDKSFSRSDSRRIPEVVLYVVALFGGSPGLLAGTHIFKHKTRKAPFQFTLLIIFVLQIWLVRTFGFEVR